MLSIENSVNPAVAHLADTFEFERIVREDTEGLAHTVTLLEDVNGTFIVSYANIHHTTDSHWHALEMYDDAKRLLTLH